MTNLYQRIMTIVGTEIHKGSPGDPPQPRSLYYADGKRTTRTDPEAYVITAKNDGYELWIGTRDRWSHHMRHEDVRLLTWYLIWDWYIKSRWLGLRRPIYYWALRRHLALIAEVRRHRHTIAAADQIHRPVGNTHTALHPED